MLATQEIKRPALRYYGGKWNLAPWIIQHFPDHKNYVEPCAGAASVLLQKPRSDLEIYNDLDGNVVNFFKVAREQPDELARVLRLTPYARGEFEFTKQHLDDPDHVERARRFLVCGYMSISGVAFDSSGWRSTSYSGQHFTNKSDNFFNLVESDIIHQIADRFKRVQIECRDGDYIIDRYDRYDSLIYFDPPYLPETRKAKKAYLVDQGYKFHVESAKQLTQAKGFVVVSGYQSPLYTEMYEEQGWVRVDIKAATNGADKIESIWLSPRTWEALQEPKQLGF